MLEIHNLSHNYNTQGGRPHSTVVFDHLNLRFSDREIVAIVGPSGCGKSTLVNILAGYIEPSTGTVTMDDFKIKAPGRDRIVIHQENDLFEWMTVYKNMRMICDDPNRINEFLFMTKLSGFENAYPSELSGGMKKRLSLARALLTDARFIIMDEPFSSLDSQIKDNLHLEILNIIRATQKSIIIVTHDVDEAIFLSDRVIVLSGQPATVRDILSIPFPRERDLSIKDTPQFIAIKQNIKTLLY